MDNILAGPILRRVDETQINIWLASREPLSLKGCLYDQQVTRPALSAQSSCKRVRLGEGLFVYLLQITPELGADPFPKGELLYYDLLIQHDDGSETSIVHQNPNFVFYESGHQLLPSFFIAEKLKRVLHGSCRRPHSAQAVKGWKKLDKMDQLKAGADLIEAHFDDLNERPAALFLTGDQIYADDVAMPVLAMLIKQSRTLTGWDERMPVNRQGSEVTPADIKLHRRMRELKLGRFGITSGAADNHLLSFGEYAAMYLAAFGGAVSLPRKSAVYSHIDASAGGTYKGERNTAGQFFSARREIRRLLANIPVYMIFDDHEVTDDWNLNPAWEAKMYGNPFGKRMVSNALAAYWAFQGWGNDPDHFDNTFIDTIQAHLNQHQSLSVQADAFDAQMLDRQTVDRWSYTLPTKPFTVVLDTRMQRAVGTDGDAGAAALMNATACDWLAQVLEQQRNHRGEDYAVLMISAAPVFGFARIEKLQQQVENLGIVSVAALDLESWQTGFASLESALMRSSNGVQLVTILSGDVHYSFSAQGSFNNADRSLQIKAAQLVSSPLSNKPSGGIIGKALLKVNDNEFPELLRPQESDGRITSLNNIGLVFFADDGSTDKHVLITKKRQSAPIKYALTYQYPEGSELL